MKTQWRNKIIAVIWLWLPVLTIAAPVGQTPINIQDRQIRRMASEFERSGELNKAADIYYMMSIQNPADLTSYEGAKRTMLQLQDLDRLEGLIHEVQKSRRDIRYEVDLAEIEYLRGNTRAAQDRWEAVLDNNALTQAAYARVGEALTRHGLFDEAVDCYRKARKKMKNDNLFIFELAALYAQQQEYKEVTEEYVRFLNSNPKQQHYIDSRFKALEITPSSVPEIVKGLKNAIREHPKIRLELHQILGNVYARNSEYEAAFEQFNIMEDSLNNRGDPRAGLYLYQFAILCTNEGQFKMARDVFESLVQNYPNSKYSLPARLGFAAILEHKGEYQEAINTYESFIKQYPHALEAHDALMKIGDIYYERLQDPKAAIQTYKRLLKKWPKSPKKTETLFKLGECEIESDQLNNARASFNMVLLEHQRKKDIDYKKALYAMANTWFLDGNLEACQEFLDQYFSNNIKGNRTDVFENDALELNMLITENRMDSVGLVTLAKARLLAVQKHYRESDSLLVTFIEQNPQTMLFEQMDLFRADIYIQQQQYQNAAVLLDSLYRNDQLLYRDKALWTLAGLYAGPLDQKPKAMELYESLLVKFPESIYIEETRKQIRNLQ